ncbi:unnamed protein product [Heligmosomoides polygyrus]|uniref:Protein kinase domain-containing protein n=1 Tax=Heligmosomoides polygyrus TaxID=6339 RepID=A0A183F728_HELPZ|nr:unnamed protein product [Heligmosomoides polygyrus]
MKRAKPDPDRSQKAEGWPYWKALQFLDPILDTGERYVSTPSMSQSSHFSDHTLEDITDYDENVAPEFFSERRNATRIGPGIPPEAKATVERVIGSGATGIIRMSMASTLRNIADYDDVLAQEFKMKVDQLQLEATREVIRFKRGPQN